MYAHFCILNLLFVRAFTSIGSKLQPWVQFQRRALILPSNATYANLTAFLTVSSSTQDTQYFPYLQGLHPNYTGNTSARKTRVGMASDVNTSENQHMIYVKYLIAI